MRSTPAVIGWSKMMACESPSADTQKRFEESQAVSARHLAKRRAIQGQ
jgi:hypothetical protein